MKTAPFHLLVLILFSFQNHLSAQTATQVIRGTFVEKESREPLAGILVEIVGTADTFRSITDSTGEFYIENIRLGRYTLYASAEGYMPYVRTDLVLSAGKQMVINGELEADVVALKTAKITQKKSD